MPTVAGTDTDAEKDEGVAKSQTPEQAGPSGPERAPQESPKIDAGSMESLRLADGADMGVARYCDRFFVSPESARSGSKALLTAFEDNGNWLSSLVQPGQLVAEVRQSCNALASHVMMHWINQGETHKLARFADALLEANPPLATHEAGQIMALLASMLGILRPLRAQNLLAAALPLLEDAVDAKLREEAAEWVEIGRLLNDTPPDQRLLWNRRLREPDEDWEWESPEARAALQRLAPTLRTTTAHLARFKRLVPGCWWDLVRENPLGGASTPAPVLPAAAAGTRRWSPGSLAAGLMAGACLAVAAGWWIEPPQGNPSAPSTQTKPALGSSMSAPSSQAVVAIQPVASVSAATLPARRPAAPPTASAPPPQPPTAIPASPSSPARLPVVAASRTTASPQALARAEPPPAPSSSASSRQATEAPTAPPIPAPNRALAAQAAISKNTAKAADPPPAPAQPLASPSASSPDLLRRQSAAAEIAKDHPQLQRLHNLVKTGAFRENEILVSGRSSLVPAPGPEYAAFLRWLLLDPPQDPETSRLAAKLATRLLSARDLYGVLELISYPGSPNQSEAREIAGLLLSLEQGGLSAAQRGTLETLARSDP